MSQTTEPRATYALVRQRGECPFDPPPEQMRLFAEEPVAQISLYNGSRAWLVTSHELGVLVLKDKRFSVRNDLPGFPFVSPGAAAWRKQFKIFPHLDNPEHNRQRRTLTPDFSKARMRELRPRIQGIVEEAIERMAALEPPVDLVREFALPVP